MWASIITQFCQNDRFIISSHLNPDCDALGSELALAYHLRSLGKDVTILNADAVPEVYQFLDPQHLIHTFSEKRHASVLARADVIIVVDVSGGWQRLGRVGTMLAQLKAVSICIDHHPNGDPFTRISLVDPGVSATGELIFNLITAMGGTVTPLMAEALYAAILTDSGSFRFSNTGSATHRIIARLLECGANPSQIYNRLYEQLPLSRVQLKGYVLQNIQLAAKGQIAWVSLSLELLQTFGVASSELDGFSSMPMQIAGVKVAIFLVELPRERIKISLRSDGSVPVNRLAALFDGGGHLPAAGAIVSGSMADITARALAEAEKMLSA